jgi:carbamoyl-phosphate synthase large subunit
MIIIEMNPRVSRSSALASKATGFPIAKVAAKLAIGYTLDEIPNDITGETLAAFEPTIDYVITKIPRFDFEKFPSATGHLGVQMQSVGEAMAIGRTFRESIQKAFRSLEVGFDGLEPRWAFENDPDLIRARSFDLTSLRFATAFRLLKIREAFITGKTIEEIHEITRIDRWFLHQIKMLCDQQYDVPILELKEKGFSDAQIARQTQSTNDKIREKKEE